MFGVQRQKFDRNVGLEKGTDTKTKQTLESNKKIKVRKYDSAN